jgi:hypothetical protein
VLTAVAVADNDQGNVHDSATTRATSTTA